MTNSGPSVAVTGVVLCEVAETTRHCHQYCLLRPAMYCPIMGRPTVIPGVNTHTRRLVM